MFAAVTLAAILPHMKALHLFTLANVPVRVSIGYLLLAGYFAYTALPLGGAFALVAIFAVSNAGASGPSMMEVAQRLYANAAPESFDANCKGKGASLSVEGDRHTCTRPTDTRIVKFASG